MGGLFLLIGVLGVFLPLLPATPFFILAGLFFSKGSEKFHDWLLNHRLFGPPINDWNKNKVIRLHNKLLATTMLTVSALYIFPRENIPTVGKVAFGILAASVLIFIWSRPSRPQI